TARGSGTNGYVQQNKATLRPRQHFKSNDYNSATSQPPIHRQPNKDLIQHEKKRKVEIECLLLRDSLEQDGSLGEDEIDKRVDELRKKLLARLDSVSLDSSSSSSNNSHVVADAKQKLNQQAAQALGI
ncbi:cwf21-domain-containing protein, partial [Rhizoclosmatium globosum]